MFFLGAEMNDCMLYHVMYVSQSESTLYSCLNVKELLTWNRCNIWELGDCNRTGTHNHLVCKAHRSIIWPVWLNGWEFIYKLKGSGFESCCSRWNEYCLILLLQVINSICCFNSQSVSVKLHFAAYSLKQIKYWWTISSGSCFIYLKT